MIELGGERQGSRDAYKVVCEQMVVVEEQVARASRQNVYRHVGRVPTRDLANQLSLTFANSSP